LARRIEKEARRRYGDLVRWRGVPYVCGQIAELPTTLPDDEILVDALRLRNPAVLLRVFGAMVREAAATGAFLVLQIHPERFNLCAEAIHSALTIASNLDGWNATLTEAAEWTLSHHGPSVKWPNGCSFAIAVTGDLDILTLPDFADRFRRVSARES
jgi:hypothetical protein